MINCHSYIQLFIRLALGTSFLSAVADRLGRWGKNGDPFVSWGDWPHFVAYTHQLNPFASAEVAEALAVAATLLEILFAIALTVGIQIRKAAVGAGVLLLLFALAIAFGSSIKYSFDFSVFTAAAASFSLLSFREYRWSVDSLTNIKNG